MRKTERPKVETPKFTFKFIYSPNNLSDHSIDTVFKSTKNLPFQLHLGVNARGRAIRIDYFSPGDV